MKLLPAAAAAVTGIQVGSAMVATRFVVDQAGPASLALLRYVLPIALLGITQFGVLVALLNYGLHFVPSARAALIFGTFPLLTMLVAAALGQERLGVAKIAGVLLTVAGVGVALGEKAIAPAPGSGGAWTGELAVFASALAGAVCSVLYRPYLARYPTLPVSAFAMLASVGFLSLLALPEGFFASLPRFTITGWLAVAFIGIGSGIGYYLWLWALNHAAATDVTVFLALSPITATWLGAWLLGEPLSPMSVFGCVLVGLGLWVAHRASPDLVSNEVRARG